MPAEMLTKSEQRGTTPAAPIEDADLRVAMQRQAKRVRRLKLHAAAWVWERSC